MNAKDLQLEFIKTYLKPTLKEYGYKTSGQTWWKNMGDFFIVINLQNSQWNSKDELSFCFNIGIALTVQLKDTEKKKATYSDMIGTLRESAFLPKERDLLEHRKGGWLGYVITDKTNVEEFINEIAIDVEENVLKILDQLKTLKDCVLFFERFIQGRNLRIQMQKCGYEL